MTISPSLVGIRKKERKMEFVARALMNFLALVSVFIVGLIILGTGLWFADWTTRGIRNDFLASAGFIVVFILTVLFQFAIVLSFILPS